MSTDLPWWEIFVFGVVLVFGVGKIIGKFNVIITELKEVKDTGVETKIEVKEIKATINAELPHIKDFIKDHGERIRDLEKVYAKKTA